MSCTGEHRKWTPTHTNNKLSESKQPCQARRGRTPMALAHRGHEQSSRGSPEGPTPAVVGSPHAPACPAYDRWRWRWPPAGNDPQCGSAPLFSLEGIQFGHPNPPKGPSPTPGQSWGPSLELLTGFPDPSSHGQGPSPTGRPCHPLPGCPGRPYCPGAEAAALPRSSRRCVHM